MAVVNGSWLTTLGGVSETVQDTAYWTKDGMIASVFIPAMAGSSNSIALYIEDIPADILPVTNAVYIPCPTGQAFYNGGNLDTNPISGWIGTATSRLYFNRGASWTMGGTQKGIAYPICLTYLLY